MEGLSLENMRKIRTFIIKAFLRINQNDPEVLAIYQDKLYELGDIIKQKDQELFDFIIRNWTDEYSSQKIKVEINRAMRTRN